MPPTVASQVALLYPGLPIWKESCLLDNESNEDVPEDEVRIRLLHEFVLFKNGVPVAPKFEDCFPEYWVNIEAYGLMAFPCERSRWFLWAGRWELDFDYKHYELVHIKGVSGMVKEHNQHFRNGNVPALWLEGKEGFSYGLMRPAEPFAKLWSEGVETWAPDTAGKGGSPAVEAVPRPLVCYPHWWCGRGKTRPVASVRAFRKLVKSVDAQLEQEARERGELGSSDEE
ncbi:hypothetical protein FRC06_010828, partial [Ceratobasidium sp. 370]